MTFRLPHLLAAVAIHVVLLGLIVSGAQCSGKTHRSPVINAVLLDPSRQEVAQQKRREEQRKAELERQRREEEARRAERKAQAEAAAKTKKDEEARKARLAADQKRAADQKKQVEQKKATEQKQQAETQARRDAEERARLAEAMQAEEAQRRADRAADARDAKLAEWAIALTRHVARNWVRPPNTGDFECRVRMQLLPDGTVTNAKIEKSCGSAQLDRSVEDAVYRASPLPKPSDPSVFDRDLTIRFVPES